MLEMTVDEAIEFFGGADGLTEKKIVVKRLRPLADVGLGYIRLGQSSSTLSGGENQRVDWHIIFRWRNRVQRCSYSTSLQPDCISTI